MTSTGEWPKGAIWNAVDVCMAATRRVLLYGPPGTGKTRCATLAGLQPDEQVFTVTMTPETPASAMLGHFIPKPNASGTATTLEWLDGPGIAAWRCSKQVAVGEPTKRARLVVNEIDHAGPDAVSALHVLLDDLATAAITLPTGETVRPGKHLRIVATMNGVPDDLSPALADRFPVAFPINEVHPDALARLPEWMRDLASDSVISPDSSRRVSIRAWYALAELLAKGVPDEIAARAVMGSRYLDLLHAMKVAVARSAR